MRFPKINIVCIVLLTLAAFHCPARNAAGAPRPEQWGERVPGVLTSFRPRGNDVALTFDMCGGPKGSELDRKLVNFLMSRHIAATFFITGRWIRSNPDDAAFLASCPTFDIQNHGMNHRPASLTGRRAYGIAGTASRKELLAEADDAARLIRTLTGRTPRFFRSGTNYYEETAVSVLRKRGYAAAGYSVLGDAGGTWPRRRVKEALLAARPGDIVLLHANRPARGTAEGVIDAVPEMLAAGIRFVTLSDAVAPPSE